MDGLGPDGPVSRHPPLRWDRVAVPLDPSLEYTDEEYNEWAAKFFRGEWGE